MRRTLLLAAALALTACAEDPQDQPPPPYEKPDISTLSTATKAEQQETLAYNEMRAQRNFERAQERKRKKAEELGEPPPPPKTRTARTRKIPKSVEVISVNEALCGWAEPELAKFDGYAKGEKNFPRAGYYCDMKVKTADNKGSIKRVFAFQKEGRWTVYATKKAFKTPLTSFARLDDEDYAAYTAEQARKKAEAKKAKEEKKKERQAKKAAGA